MTSPLPSEELELRAANQRARLRESVDELRSSVRERLDVKRVARDYVWRASGVAALVAFSVGYTVAGAFRD